MRLVFIETTWVVDYAAPAHLATPAARTLLDRARDGEIQILLPSICLIEAKHTIPRKFQATFEANRIRQFLAWAKVGESISAADDENVRRVLDMMEGRVKNDLDGLSEKLGALHRTKGVEVFHPANTVFETALALTLRGVTLQPFDLMILSSILIRARELALAGQDDVVFCATDADLQPWDKNGARKDPLASVYDSAGVWVFGDLTMETPARPAGWKGEKVD